MNDVNFIEPNYVKQKGTFPINFSLPTSSHSASPSIPSTITEEKQSDSNTSFFNKRHANNNNKKTFVSRSIKGLKSIKKNDIRVSRFVPVGINFSEDTVTTLRNVEEQTEVNDIKKETLCNTFSSSNYNDTSDNTKKFPEKKSENLHSKPQGNVFNVLKFFQDGVKRFGSSSSKTEPSWVIRTVEIVRNPDEVLGITIKQKKVFHEGDIAMNPHCNQQAKSSNSTREGIFVSKLASHCKAAKQGLLQVGDEILTVNTICIAAYDLKSVAAMMCMLKRLILTVQRQLTNYSFDSKDADLSEKKFCLLNSSLNTTFSNNFNIESETTEEVSLVSDLNVKHSVYDNNPSLMLSTQNHSDYLPPNNLLKLKFDESVQILYEAIAGCDKSNISKSKTSETLSLKRQLSSNSYNFHSVHISDSDKRQVDGDTIFKDLSYSSSKYTAWQPYVNINIGECVNNLSRNEILFGASKCGSNVEGSIDDTPTFSESNLKTGLQSNHSSNQEVNLDDIQMSFYSPTLHRKLQHSQSLNQTESSRFVTSASAEDVGCNRFALNLDKNESNVKACASDSDISVISNKNCTSVENQSFKRSVLYRPIAGVPKFPISLIEPSPAVQTMLQPLVTFNRGNITVDKKKEWFNSGNAVSEELKKRIDGENRDKVLLEQSVFQTDIANKPQVLCNENSFSTYEKNKYAVNMKNTKPFLAIDIQRDNGAVTGTDEKHTVAFSKITSPVQNRKKKTKKWTKKFRIAVNSESAMSGCLNGEDDTEQLPDERLLNKHLNDLDMSHERRLSRQLCLETKSKEFSSKFLSISQFQKYKPLPVIGCDNSPPVDGCLVITLYGVKELKKGSYEACCLVQVDDALTKRVGTTRQAACKGGTTWNQCFEMIVSQARNLQFTVYSWSSREEKQNASSAIINLPLLLQGHKTLHSNRLAISLNTRGILYIKLGLERSPFSSGSRLFGADLQSIVNREGGEIPVLVRSCIEEVEARGMHVVGIYRLCGSAIVKRDLRRKLEETGGKVDLASSDYPDINVITGILKDFLRELPQPIFPPELLEAISSVIEEKPGLAPSSVIKESFSTNQLFNSTHNFDQLRGEEQKKRTNALLGHIKKVPSSRAQRFTLYALMNHLKKVALHSDTNKMIYQNLAVCFGPVLLGPINSVPTNRMDFDAAIGFKRHIQVLNYMISNWPAQPALPSPEVVPRRKTNRVSDRAPHNASPRTSARSRNVFSDGFEWLDKIRDKMTSALQAVDSDLDTDDHRVSLTQRLSRICVDDVDTVDGDMQGTSQSSLVGIPEYGGAFCDPVLP